MKNTFGKRAAGTAIASTIALAAILVPSVAADAARLKVSTLVFDFNTAGNLANDFTSYVAAGTLDQTADGGIGNTGAIAPAGNGTNTNAVVEPNANYSMGPVGAKYTFTGYMKSEGSSGYSGFGFTTLDANASGVDDTKGSMVFRPHDALGISVHGGGFIFHNGDVDYEGGWTGASGDITTVVAYDPSKYPGAGGDLIGDANVSPDLWYKIIYSIEKTSATNFKSRVEVWPARVDGTLLYTTASAIFEVATQSNQAISASTELASYINFNGYRMTKFDNFSTTVVGAKISGAPAGSVTEEADPTETTSTGGGDLANTGASNDSLPMIIGGLGAIVAGLVLALRRKSADK